ncbi:MFS transporter [Labrys neptuniae]
MTTPPLAEQRLASFDRSGIGIATADRRRRLTLIAMCIAAFMIQLDVTIVNVALPTIQQSLDAGIGQTEWVLSGYALGLAAFIPLAGGLGDRFGHKAIFLGGLALFGAASMGCALAHDGLFLIASRLLQGIGGSAVLALTLAILTQTYPAPSRGQAIGTWAAMGGIGFGLGPVFGGVLLASYGWPSIFWVNLPFTVAALILTGIALPGGRASGAKRPLDGLGIALASLGLAVLTFGLIEATGNGLMSPVTLAPLVAGLLLLGLFFWWQRRATHPLVPAGLRGARSFIGACAVYFTSYTAFAGTLYYVTMLFQNFAGWSPLQTGLSWLLMNLPFLIAAQLAGRIGRRFLPRTIIVTGCMLAGLGIALLACLTGVGDFRLAVLGYLLTGSGFGALVPGITHVAMRDVPQNAAGAGSAILNCARQLGTATGLAAIGALGSLATTGRWSGAGSQLPDVIAGRLDAITHNLGSTFGPEAATAFLDGYRVALTACALCLAIATIIAARAFRPQA